MSKINRINSDLMEIGNLQDIAEIMGAVSSLTFVKFSRIFANIDSFFNDLDSVNEKFALNAVGNINNHDALKTAGIFIGSDYVFCSNFNRLIYDEHLKITNQTTLNKTVLIGKQIKYLDDKANHYLLPDIRNLKEYDILKKFLDFSTDVINRLEADKIILIHNILDSSNKIQTRKIELNLFNTETANIRLNSVLHGFDEVYDNYIIDPDINRVFSKFLNFYAVNSLIRALFVSIISENYIRMTTMNTAKDEALILIKKLKKELNKLRQAKITKELIEVINSFSQLKGKNKLE